MRKKLTIILLATITQAQAFTWHDLWRTKDQQAQIMMNAGNYSQAAKTYEDPKWQASAAYRSHDYSKAASLYQETKSFYNHGNALAKSGELELAIKAYDQAITLEPNNQDAIYNRKLVASLIKKSKQQQKQQQQQKQESTPQPQPKTSPAEREQKQAKDQWLKLVPEDPGGLMRAKFLRDYLNRH